MRVLDRGVLKTHWLLRSRPVGMELYRIQSEQHAESVRGTIRTRGIGVYVHIPYCKYTCIFCPYF